MAPPEPPIRPPAPFVLIMVAMAACVALAGCGRGFDRNDAVDAFERANPEVTEADAGCVVDRLIDRYGIDGLADELESGEPSPGFTESRFRDMFACGIEGDVSQRLVEQLVASGVDRTEAPCVAESLAADLADRDIDVLLSGEITEAFMAKFAEAMEDCDAVG